MKKIKEISIYLLIIVMVILIRTFIITPVRVNGTSMDPTLKNGEIMILNKIKYNKNDIKRFDIVVVKMDKELLIKRVIGLPNEEIKYVDNKLYINGEYIKEPFLNDDVYTTFTLYQSGALSKEQTLETLKIKKLYDQMVFTSEKALSFLKFIGTIPEEEM